MRYNRQGATLKLSVDIPPLFTIFSSHGLVFRDSPSPHPFFCSRKGKIDGFFVNDGTGHIAKIGQGFCGKGD
jgi:hypothetical protein